ncbi:putative virion structural protein [Salmonella phage vB_SalM_SA002]|nr:putative virion structural protein [Salmonella phage vB_SalM_SA002]
MQIYLNWENLNSNSVKLEIFRGDAPLDRNNLPDTPIATLTGGETNYTDTKDVLLGKTYYYVFVTSNATDRAVSQNYEVTAISRRGYGPQKLIQGDNTLGYFGSIPSGEFIYPNALATAVGVTTAIFANISMPRIAPLWHKYVRNNKILIIPEGPIALNVSWKGLYDLGLVFGQDGDGTNSFAQSLFTGPYKPQTGKVKIGADWYRVRLMKTWFDTPSVEVPSVQNKVPYPEFDDLTSPIYHQVIPTQRLNNFYLNGRYYYADLTLNGTMNTYLLGQEIRSANYCSARGPVNLTSSDLEYGAKMMLSKTLAFDNVSGITTQGYEWWPVLELIEG